MGLFAGISVISIIEVVFQFFLTASKQVVLKIQRNKVYDIEPMQKPRPQNLLKALVNHDHVLYQFVVFLHKFVNRSDIHGLHYITDKNNKGVERILWAIIVLTSTVFCSMIIFDAVRNSEISPFEFGIDEKLWNREDVRFY